MVCSVCLLFSPALLIGLWESDTLLVIWSAKCALNLARLGTAGWFVYKNYDPSVDPTWLEAAVEIGRGSSLDEEAGLMLASAAEDDAEQGGSPHQALVDRGKQSTSILELACSYQSGVTSLQSVSVYTTCSSIATEISEGLLAMTEVARKRAVREAHDAEQATHAEMDAELAEVHAKIGALSPQPGAARGSV